MKSTIFAKANDVERKWYIIDAAGISLGRVATEAARMLRGKHKPIFTPNVDTGDFIIIINAEKAVLTGNKLNDKMYRHHSGYPGGLKRFLTRILCRICRSGRWNMLLKECFLIISWVRKCILN